MQQRRRKRAASSVPCMSTSAAQQKFTGVMVIISYITPTLRTPYSRRPSYRIIGAQNSSTHQLYTRVAVQQGVRRRETTATKKRNPFRSPIYLATLTSSNLPPKAGFLFCSHISHRSENQVSRHRTGSNHSGVEEHPREKKMVPVCALFIPLSRLTMSN